MSLRPKRVEFHTLYASFVSEVASIYSFSPSSTPAMKIYQLVFDLCIAIPDPFHTQLYSSLLEFLNTHCTSISNTISNSSDILKTYTNAWSKYSSATLYTCMLCEYLDRTRKRLAKRNEVIVSVKDSAWLVWKNNVVSVNGPEVVQACLKLVAQDRDSNVPFPVVSSVWESLVTVDSENLTAYREYYENEYLRASRDYFSSHAAEALNQLSISEYLQSASRVLAQEISSVDSTCSRYLHESSFEKFTQTYDECWIDFACEIICDKVFVFPHSVSRDDYGRSMGRRSTGI